ncbi:MAG: iron chaperone [Pirellulales bacterium]
MKKKAAPLESVDEYIAGFPRKVQAILGKIRATIRKAAPQAEERISYRMPGYFQGGILIYFAGYEQHVGLYPAPRGVEEFAAELSAYEGGKGTIRLPLDKPIPYGLISRIVKYRLASNQSKASAKAKSKRQKTAKRAAPPPRKATTRRGAAAQRARPTKRN